MLKILCSKTLLINKRNITFISSHISCPFTIATITPPAFFANVQNNLSRRSFSTNSTTSPESKQRLITLSTLSNLPGAFKRVRTNCTTNQQIIFLSYYLSITFLQIVWADFIRHNTNTNTQRRRFGRGMGSRRGKNAGHGHQRSRVTPRGFEGGQTPLYKSLPKIGFHNFT